MVASRHHQLKTGKLNPKNLCVPGADWFLNLLQERLGENLYLASGTDIKPILESATLLGFNKYFGDRIKAAGSAGPKDCAKELVIKHLVEEKSLKTGELVAFGDGFPEILHCYNAGGVSMGVLSADQSNYELLGHLTVEQKRMRLVNAGAHILIKDFSDAEKLIEVLFSKRE